MAHLDHTRDEQVSSMKLPNIMPQPQWARAALFALLLSIIGAHACAAANVSTEVQLPVVTTEMRTYSHIRYALYFVWFFYASSVFVVLSATGISTRIRAFAEKRSARATIQFLIYFVILFLCIHIATLPLSFISGFILEHHFHLTHQSFLDWLWDRVKEALLAMSLSAPALGAFFWSVRKFPRRWPYLFWAATSVLIAIGSFISPILLEPVMNKFTPMPPTELRNQIEALAAKAGAADAPVLIADKSKQTNKLNAYVSGLGSSTHIVIWDTTLNKLPQDQILAIVGHELGHYYLNHVLWDFWISVGANALLIPMNVLFARGVIAMLPKRWGIRGLDDFAVTPVLMLAVAVGGFIADPVINAWSRYQEAQADAFSLHITGNGPALARGFVSLSEQNLSEPDPPPFIKFWLFSHPSLKERIEFALHNTGQ